MGLIEMGGFIWWGGGGLINLVKMMVSVLHKELECKVEKLNHKKLEVMQPRIKTNLNFQHMNKPSWISPNKGLQLWLINTVYHLLVKTNEGEGGWLILERAQ